ncbi:MAG: hypothetical protein QM779_12265 [Propionicimonas sp.]|uniref:hypothetical protein n=1 Tax=Propionicimonas sp. TaxID=1955623 RepID=UPI003D11B790
MFKIVVFLLILVVLGFLFVRVFVPFVRRTVGQPASPTIVPGEVVADPTPGTFPVTMGRGYDPEDVEELFEKVYRLAETPSGRVEALEAVRSTRFHLARKGGYETVFVDDRLDAIADALTSGRALPPRPGLR